MDWRCSDVFRRDNRTEVTSRNCVPLPALSREESSGLPARCPPVLAEALLEASCGPFMPHLLIAELAAQAQPPYGSGELEVKSLLVGDGCVFCPHAHGGGEGVIHSAATHEVLGATLGVCFQEQGNIG